MSSFGKFMIFMHGDNMIDKIMEFIDHFIKRNRYKPNVDLNEYHDEVAYLTSFEPLTRGGANFATRKMVTDKLGNYYYRATLPSRLFALPFVVFGLVMINVFFDQLPALIGGIVFLTVAAVIIVQSFKRIVFDDTRQLFFVGFKQNSKNSISYKQVHSLQLLAKVVRSSTDDGPDTFYFVYELNLVDHQGQRMNVHCYNSKDVALDDANSLSKYLNVPLWQAL